MDQNIDFNEHAFALTLFIKIRASCGNATRGDLRGGYRVTDIPTATRTEHLKSRPRQCDVCVEGGLRIVSEPAREFDPSGQCVWRKTSTHLPFSLRR